MCKSICVCCAALIFSGAVLANTTPPNASVNKGPHFYAGLQLGYGSMEYSIYSDVPATVNDSGFAGRVTVGVDLNKFLGMEIGYLYLPDATIKFDGVDGKLTIEQQSIDFLIAAQWSLSHDFKVKGKVGIAKTKQDFTGVGEIVWDDARSWTKVVPVAGVGVVHHIIPEVAIDLSYMRYFKSGDVEAVNFLGVGATYFFGH